MIDSNPIACAKRNLTKLTSSFLPGNPFIFNFFTNVFLAWRGKKNVDDNPWQATTIDWAATTSPPLGHGNFAVLPVVHRGPYEYSVPGHPQDYTPQTVPDGVKA